MVRLLGILTIGYAGFAVLSSHQVTSVIVPSIDHFDQDHRISSFRGQPFRQQNKPPRYAIVHLVDKFTPIYEAALLSSVHRAVNIHSNVSSAIFSGQLDLVVMVHESVNLTGYEHPYIRFVSFNGDEIQAALSGKGYPEWEIATHFKLAPMNLVEYEKVVFVDLDYVLRHQLASILLETQPPAMVQWGEYPQIDFNSGFHILRPSSEMFQDAVGALKKIGGYYEATEKLQDISTGGALRKNIPSDPSPYAGYRSDQEFMYAFYESLPDTRQKWGPIHPLPYRYNAREESVSFNTARFLTRTTTNTKPKLTPPGVFDGAHLHLFGDFGQDGRGHRLNPIPKEDGIFGLIGVHFTTRKPWKEGRIHNKTINAIRFEEDVVNDFSLRPEERCSQYFYHINFWEGVMNGILQAMKDRRYGFRWMTDELFEYFQSHTLVQRCFVKELKELLEIKDKVAGSSGGDCVDAGDCSNKHCKWRSSSQSQKCQSAEPDAYISLVKNV